MSPSDRAPQGPRETQAVGRAGRGRLRIMLVAGEASGEGYAAALARAVRALAPEATFFGMGGGAMRAAGVHLLYDVGGRGAVGFAEAVRQVPLLRRVMARLVEAARRLRPQVAVLVDFPGFNLRLGPALSELGVPVVYYVVPAVWAWGAGRARTVAGFSRRAICAFDFEVPLYRQAGAHAVWLGHPILDDVPPRPPREEARRALALGEEGPVVALLPGSRLQEIRQLYPMMVQAARAVRAALPRAAFVASAAPGIDPRLLESVAGPAHRELGVVTVDGGIWRALAPADVAVACSGTATLQAALWQVPMVVVYRVSHLTYLAARKLVKIPYIALPNIVVGRALVEELLQHDARPERVARAVLERLSDPQRLAREREALASVRRRLGEPGCAARAAREVLEVAGR